MYKRSDEGNLAIVWYLFFWECTPLFATWKLITFNGLHNLRPCAWQTLNRILQYDLNSPHPVSNTNVFFNLNKMVLKNRVCRFKRFIDYSLSFRNKKYQNVHVFLCIETLYHPLVVILGITCSRHSIKFGTEEACYWQNKASGSVLGNNVQSGH